MENEESRRPSASGRANASLVISMLALLMAVTGVATAGKTNGNVKLPPNSVGSAQLRAGAVKTTDLGRNSVVTSKVAPNTVTSKVLAPDSVTSADMAPGSVQAANLASDSVTSEKIMNGAVNTGKLSDGSVDTAKLRDGSVGTEQFETGAVTSGKIGPRAVTPVKIDTAPGARVSVGTTPMNQAYQACFMRSDVPFDTVDRNVSGVFDPGNPDQLKAPISGIYRVTAGVTWNAAGGVGRILSAERTIGSGPNVGQHYEVQGASTAPVSGGTTNQTLAFDVAFDKDDFMTAFLGTCGADATASQVNFGMIWTGPAS